MDMSTHQSNPNQAAIPAGYMTNRKGHLVKESDVYALDLELDAFVKKHLAKAQEIQNVMREFKQLVYDDCQAFQELIFEKYGATFGGKKGNTSFTSYDGKYQIRIVVQERFVFGQELKVAEKLMKQCANEWSDGAREELKRIIHGLFETDKEGSISVAKIMDFRRSFKNVSDDEAWVQAMDAIDDALRVVGSKMYLNFKERNAEDKYINIPLDIAKL